MTRTFESDQPCSHCGDPLPSFASVCQHCGTHHPPPNVRAAAREAERAELGRRYDMALEQAKKEGAIEAVGRFERAVEGSAAVMARDYRRLLETLVSDNPIFRTYFTQINDAVRFPEDNSWDLYRAIFDQLMFPHYFEHIHYALLSIDDSGSQYYGPVILVLESERISNRTTVFERNSRLFLEEGNYSSVPSGYRAVWSERAKLAVAKLARLIGAETSPDSFGSILHDPGGGPDGEYIEVHIHDPLTVKAIRRAFLSRTRRDDERIAEVVRLELLDQGVLVEEMP